MTAQGRSTSLPGTDWSSHEPAQKPALRTPPTTTPTDSAAQNQSSVFGTPHRSTSAPVLSELSSESGGTAKSFAPGEWVMPTPRDAALGAPKSRAEQSVSSSLPGTRYSSAPPKPVKEQPQTAASSKAEQGRSSSLPGTDWSTFKVAGPDKGSISPAFVPDPATKNGRNISSVFGTPRPVTPPPRPSAQKPTIATSTAAQQRSSVFGSPHVASPKSDPPKPEYAASLHMDAPRAASPIRPRHKPRDPSGLMGSNGKPRAPSSKAEQQVSSILGGSLGADAQQRMSSQHHVSRSLLKVEFTGLPSDSDTHRLHQGLSAIPFDKGITCDVRKVSVPYDALNGRAIGSGTAQFRNVPDRDRLLAALRVGQEKGWLKARSWKVTYDDTKAVEC